jgi:hypothetical protein
MSHEILLPYNSPFHTAEHQAEEFTTFTVGDLIEQTIPPEIEQVSSDIFLLLHLFGPEAELEFKVQDGREMTFRLDGSNAMWQIEDKLDISERGNYQWTSNEIKIASVGVMADPDRCPVSELKRIDQLIVKLIESPTPPSAIIQHGPRVQFIWKLTCKPKQTEIDDFEGQFHTKFETMSSDMELYQITPGLRDIHMHKPSSTYLSDAEYPPKDLTQIYDDLTALPLSPKRTPTPAWRKRINKAYGLLETIDVTGAIGHILAHGKEAHTNTDPRFANAWQNTNSQSIYVVQSWKLVEGSVADLIAGEGQKRLPVEKIVTPVPPCRDLELSMLPAKEIEDDASKEIGNTDHKMVGPTRVYYSLGEDFFDLQVNHVRDGPVPVWFRLPVSFTRPLFQTREGSCRLT